METAIKRAQEGGYEGYGLTLDSGAVIYDRFLLDPLFWQALGKAEGWPQGIEEEMAHQMLHSLFVGKDIDTFFSDLLK